MKTILFCGHLSRFGAQFLAVALQHPRLKVDLIILASVDRWMSFTAKLKRLEELPDQQAFKRGYHYQTKLLEQKIREAAYQTEIRFEEEANSPSMIDRLGAYELVLSAAYPQIFSPLFVAAAKGRAINFHPSYLPRCKGAHPVYWTIAAREKYGGVSSHFITDKLDAGRVLSRIKIQFDRDTIIYEALYDMLVQAISLLLDETVDVFTQERAFPQIDQFEAGSFHRENQEEDHEIDWDVESFEVISAKIRAGGAFCLLKDTGEVLRLLPPVAFQRYEKEKVEAMVKVISQSRDLISIGNKEGVFYARYTLGKYFIANWIERAVKKIFSMFMERKLIGKDIS